VALAVGQAPDHSAAVGEPHLHVQVDKALDRVGVLTMENFGRQVAALLMQAQPSERSFHLDANLWLSTPSLPRMASSALPSVAEGFLHSSGLLQGGTAASLQRHFVSQVPLAENSIPSKDNVRPGRAQNVRCACRPSYSPPDWSAPGMSNVVLSPAPECLGCLNLRLAGQ